MVGSDSYFSNLGVLPLPSWVVGYLFLVCHQQAAIFQAGRGSECLGGGGATPASTPLSSWRLVHRSCVHSPGAASFHRTVQLGPVLSLARIPGPVPDLSGGL